MAETRQQTSSSDAGNVTDFSSKAQRARGVSDVQDVSPKISQDEFLSKLDTLIGLGREQGGCSIGTLLSKVEEPVRSKLIEIMKNPNVQSAKLAVLMAEYGLHVSSSDVLRRHRRRMTGKDGCKCPRES